MQTENNSIKTCLIVGEAQSRMRLSDHAIMERCCEMYFSVELAIETA